MLTGNASTLSGNHLQRYMAEFSGGFVLAFHEISPRRLAELVDGLQPFKAVHLSELVERSRQRKSTSGLFAITVDDGVGENVRKLEQLFRVRGWPATFYVPTQYLDSGESMVFQWWQWLKPLLPRRRLHLSSGVVDLSPPGAVQQLSRKMELLWHSQRLDSYLPLTMELVEIVLREGGLTRAVPASPITWKEVAELSKNDLIRFESHGVSHAAMSSLTEDELVFEMKRSRDLVTEHTGRPCRHLAYPFGSWQSIGVRAAAAAERWYDSAVTMSLGPVDFANPWLLPRIPLYPENSTLVARMKILLKCNILRVLKPGRAAAWKGNGLEPAGARPQDV
jgi:peptidoglycan/xylan/chitin deacetylase (PgdA/CDA1 family)